MSSRNVEKREMARGERASVKDETKSWCRFLGKLRHSFDVFLRAEPFEMCQVMRQINFFTQHLMKITLRFERRQYALELHRQQQRGIMISSQFFPATVVRTSWNYFGA